MNHPKEHTITLSLFTPQGATGAVYCLVEAMGGEHVATVLHPQHIYAFGKGSTDEEALRDLDQELRATLERRREQHAKLAPRLKREHAALEGLFASIVHSGADDTLAGSTRFSGSTGVHAA